MTHDPDYIPGGGVTAWIGLAFAAVVIFAIVVFLLGALG